MYYRPETSPLRLPYNPKMVENLPNDEFFKYYRQILEDATFILAMRDEVFSRERGTPLHSPTPPSKIERALSKREYLPEDLKDLLRRMYAELEEVVLVWNLKAWEGRYSYVGRMEIPPITGLFKRDLNGAKEGAFWEFDPDRGEGKIRYYDTLDLRGKALKAFRDNLPRMYVFDRYAGEDAWTVLWIKGGRYGLALITSQGEEVLSFPHSMRRYLYLQLRTLGVFHFPELVLRKCGDPDITCILEWIGMNYDLNDGDREALESLYRDVHGMMDDVRSTLLRAHTPWGRKTTPEVRERMEELLKEGADPNSRFGNGETLLTRAAKSNDVPLMELLIRYGADPNAGDGRGNTPLSILLDRSKKNVEAIALLLGAGAEVSDTVADALLESKLLTRRKLKSDPNVRRIAEYLLENAPEGKREAIKDRLEL